MRRVAIPETEMFYLYGVSRQINLSIDRGILEWDSLKIFLSEINIKKYADFLELIGKKSFFLFTTGKQRGFYYLSLSEVNGLYLNFVNLYNLLKKNENPTKKELIDLRINFAKSMCYLEHFLPENIRDIPVEHYGQNVNLKCYSLETLAKKYYEEWKKNN